MIIADENVELHWINLLESKNYPVLSISKEHPQLPDSGVIEIAKKHKGILITEDKDFGELIFAHGISGLTIVFLRYDQPQYDLIENQVLEVVEKYHEVTGYFFITITKNHVRVRSI
jgi:predicted nuclease of predicted toxin-antitoxin system